jgi:hypothetical protein
MMLQSGERCRRKEEINRDALRHGIAGRHCRMLAKGFPHHSIVSRTARPQAEPRFRAHAQAPLAARASTRAHVLTRECAASGWTAHLRDKVTVQLPLRASAGQPC